MERRSKKEGGEREGWREGGKSSQRPVHGEPDPECGNSPRLYNNQFGNFSEGKPERG